MRACTVLAVSLLACAVVLGIPATCRAASCTVRANQVKFGNYDPLKAAPLNRTGRIIVRCSGAGTVTVALSAGQSGSYNPRYMLSGTTGDQLDYNLYTNAARNIIWGDGTGGTQTFSQPFNNNRVRLNVYARVPARQDIAPGAYRDTIDVTVNF
ncbi:MAG: spore coat protein U domain-containing protein [Gammaproteobacteria bacterium]|nr:spore coat protein U domain-containing protein [Gammaproteobacteria bacterium]